MGLGRLELPTSRLSGVRSNHLSYRPFFAWLFGPIPCRASLFAPVEYVQVHSLRKKLRASSAMPKKPSKNQ